MHLTKVSLIYILLFTFALTFILPLYTYAIDENNIYVWSDTSSSISSSTSLNNKKENSINKESIENNSRKLFRNYVWKCCTYGSKDRKSII